MQRAPHPFSSNGFRSVRPPSVNSRRGGRDGAGNPLGPYRRTQARRPLVVGHSLLLGHAAAWGRRLGPPPHPRRRSASPPAFGATCKTRRAAGSVAQGGRRGVQFTASGPLPTSSCYQIIGRDRLDPPLDGGRNQRGTWAHFGHKPHEAPGSVGPSSYDSCGSRWFISVDPEAETSRNE